MGNWAGQAGLGQSVKRKQVELDGKNSRGAMQSCQRGHYAGPSRGSDWIVLTPPGRNPRAGNYPPKLLGASLGIYSIKKEPYSTPESNGGLPAGFFQQVDRCGKNFGDVLNSLKTFFGWYLTGPDGLKARNAVLDSFQWSSGCPRALRQ